jgi:uncharacterized UBP type Zn finger protein
MDLSEFVKAKKSQETRYKLFSVLVHCGEGSSSGHYYAFIRPKMGIFNLIFIFFNSLKTKIKLFAKNNGTNSMMTT